ncbi:hypothetical protein B0H66DRAFT_533294 [Apodospora peruviana]|uniref:Uncharacterized protein n=1 Tax=Apodospora peruviana TaxID=516989 RepID=A0AAE0M4V1_9PEZI|nr:hypothetical protein B0H66DRAFT_533294 [Apodospora peruviana]
MGAGHSVPGSSSQAAKEFHFFAKLPPEMQKSIIREAISEPLFHTLIITSANSAKKGSGRTRTLALATYRFWKERIGKDLPDFDRALEPRLPLSGHYERFTLATTCKAAKLEGGLPSRQGDYTTRRQIRLHQHRHRFGPFCIRHRVPGHQSDATPDTQISFSGAWAALPDNHDEPKERDFRTFSGIRRVALDFLDMTIDERDLGDRRISSAVCDFLRFLPDVETVYFIDTLKSRCCSRLHPPSTVPGLGYISRYHLRGPAHIGMSGIEYLTAPAIYIYGKEIRLKAWRQTLEQDHLDELDKTLGEEKMRKEAVEFKILRWVGDTAEADYVMSPNYHVYPCINSTSR